MHESYTGSKRLDAVFQMISPTLTAADVGCDHGLLSIALISQKKASHVWAMDLRKGPLATAKENVHKHSLDSSIDLLLSDGLENLAENVQTVIIAGMGGETICHILTSCRGFAPERMKNVSELVLSPQSQWDTVRKTLHQTGFLVTDEDMVLDDGKFYWIVKANRLKGRNEPLQEGPGLWFCPSLSLKKHPIYRIFLNKEKEKETAILADLMQNTDSTCALSALKIHKAKLKEINRELAFYQDEE